MSVEYVGLEAIPPCRQLLEKMAEYMSEVQWWQEQAEYHESRSSGCAQMEVSMCNNQAAPYRDKAHQLGSIILDGKYSFLDLPKAV